MDASAAVPLGQAAGNSLEARGPGQPKARRRQRQHFRADPRRCLQLVFIFDEPESALSPSRQILFLRLLRRMERLGHCQVIMATHSPLLMAYPARGCCFYRNTVWTREPRADRAFQMAQFYLAWD